MKKNIIYSFAFIAIAVILTACGSNSKTDPIKVGPYSFFNATTPITITKSGGGSCSGGTSASGGLCLAGGTSCSGTSCGGTSDSNSSTSSSQISRSDGMYISVQLLKEGLALPGELVHMLSFDIAYGAIVNQYVTTDQNGRAMFEYEAPTGSNYDAIRGQDITIQAQYLDPESTSATPKVLLTQDFVLQFR
jgi:hypothetical protein